MEEIPGRAAEVVERKEPVPEASPRKQAGVSVSTVETVIQENVVAPKVSSEKSVHKGAIGQEVSDDTQDKQYKVC